MREKTSTFHNSMIWFGAAVSISEILTGTLIAPLGFAKGVLAVIIGHIIGCIFMYFSGLIGGISGKSGMETVGISFGAFGTKIFSVLNVIQLVGWTAVMIASGAGAACTAISLGSFTLWAVIIGMLIIFWILAGIKNLGIINTVAMLALFALTCLLSFIIFRNDRTLSIAGDISFGGAVELSVAMPLSWLPLISDYTRNAKKPFTASFVSVGTYFLVSVWMYIIGIGAVLLTGETDISVIMLETGFGIPAIVIIIFSTVTTTFLDVYSAGVSAKSISAKFKEKPIAIVTCVLGTILAIFTPITRFEGFLYFIGSVFAPMTAILITDYFLLNKRTNEKVIDIQNLIIWFVGFIIYRIFMNIETPLGYTLPVMLLISAIVIIINKLKEKFV